jgi:hypothetical protein
LALAHREGKAWSGRRIAEAANHFTSIIDKVCCSALAVAGAVHEADGIIDAAH